MAYLVVYDNHGREVARFHHTEVTPDAVATALTRARVLDAKIRPADESLGSVIEQAG